MDNIDIEDLITEEIDVLEEAIQYVGGGAVNSVNGKTGDVILNASDVGAATQQDINRSVETKQDKLVSSSNIKTINNQSILGSGNITIQGGGAVNSVNGQTGDVVLNATDVGAATTSQVSTAKDEAINTSKSYTNSTASSIRSEIPTKTSDLTNDSSFQTSSQVDAKISPVSSRITSVEDTTNKTVVNNISITPDTSTDTLSLNDGLINIKTGATSSASIPFPVASTTSAGVMNSATYIGLQQTTDIANGLLNGAVAVSGLATEPTQAQLTSAWKTATGRTALMNRAVLYDIANSKLWTYYTNTSTWYSAAAGGGSVDVQTWTNSQAGIVKGSTQDGQIFAETDGTGSVNGWDEVKTDIQNLENAGYQTETDVNDIIASTSVSDLADGDDYATTASVTEGLANKQDTISDLDTIRSGAALGATALQTVPSGYVTNTDYATNDTAGVIKSSTNYGTAVNQSSGALYASTYTYDNYTAKNNGAFMSKGTFENALVGKGLVKATTISSSSTDDNVATPKAVYDFVSGIDTSNIWQGTLAEYETAKQEGEIDEETICHITNDEFPNQYGDYIIQVSNSTATLENNNNIITFII